MADQTSSSAEKATVEQIITEFYPKSLQIILDSRIPSFSSQNYFDESHHSTASTSPRGRVTNKWFNLELENSAAMLECVEPWRKGCLEPMTVDVLLQQPSGEQPSPSSVGGGRYFRGSPPCRENMGGDSWSGGDVEGCASPGGLCRTILERWVVHHNTGRRKSGKVGSSGFIEGSGGAGVSRGTGGGSPLSYPSNQVVDVSVMYKRTIILLRSLYCTMRTLPAHRLFRLVNSSHHSRSFSLSYRVSSSPPPLSESDQAAMMNNSLSLTPIDTMWGRMCITVNYRHTTAVTALEITPPMEPRIITDYVGSPHTNPVRKFSGVGSVPSGVISGRKGVHVVSLPASVPSSPSGTSSHRRHSWSSGQPKMHVQQLSAASPSCRSSRSPSPTVPADFIPSSSPSSAQSPHSMSPSHHPHFQLSPRTSPSRPSLPRQYASQPPSFHQVGVGPPSQSIPFLEHGRSTPYSASPSASPPTHYPQRSAPVSIPRTSTPRVYMGSSPRRLEGPNHSLSRSPYPPPSPSRNLETLPRSLSSNSKQWTVPVANLFLQNLEGRVAPPPLSISDWAVNSSLLMSPAHPFHAHQVPGDDKGEGGPPSGVKRSLYAPPRLLLPSRGMSNLEEGDDEEFSCPFAVDDEESEAYRSRMDSPKVRQSSDTFEAVGQGHHRSQDAAVGALVRILKAAPPLRPWNLPSLVSGSPNFRTSPPALLGPAEMSSGGKLKCSSPRSTITKTRSGTTSLVGSPVSHSVVTRVPLKTSGCALDELRSFIEMRDHLQRQSGVKLASSPAKPLLSVE